MKLLIISTLLLFQIVNHKNSSSISNNVASTLMDIMDKKVYRPEKNEDHGKSSGNLNKKNMLFNHSY